LRVRTLEEGWGVLGSSNLEERVAMVSLLLTFLTEVEIGADAALIADTLNRSDTATVTGNALVNLRSLISCLLPKVVNHKSLKGLSCIGLYLLLDNLYKIAIELVLEGTRA
jgi:hypothetical protein